MTSRRISGKVGKLAEGNTTEQFQHFERRNWRRA